MKKNILAENMLRFGAKNLSESDKQLVESAMLLTEGEIDGTITRTVTIGSTPPSVKSMEWDGNYTRTIPFQNNVKPKVIELIGTQQRGERFSYNETETKDNRFGMAKFRDDIGNSWERVGTIMGGNIDKVFGVSNITVTMKKEDLLKGTFIRSPKYKDVTKWNAVIQNLDIASLRSDPTRDNPTILSYDPVDTSKVRFPVQMTENKYGGFYSHVPLRLNRVKVKPGGGQPYIAMDDRTQRTTAKMKITATVSGEDRLKIRQQNNPNYANLDPERKKKFDTANSQPINITWDIVISENIKYKDFLRIKSTYKTVKGQPG